MYSQAPIITPNQPYPKPLINFGHLWDNLDMMTKYIVEAKIKSISKVTTEHYDIDQEVTSVRRDHTNELKEKVMIPINFVADELKAEPGYHKGHSYHFWTLREIQNEINRQNKEKSPRKEKKKPKKKSKPTTDQELKQFYDLY